MRATRGAGKHGLGGTRQLLSLGAAVLGGGALVSGLLAVDAGAEGSGEPEASARAHGSMEIPMSRSYHCYLEGPEAPLSAACREAVSLAGTQQFYDWHEVNLLEADGRHRELIPDGELCSAGREKYRGLDLPRDDWPAQHLEPDEDGNIEFVYRATAPHSTMYFSFYVTREGYDPATPLRWSDLEEEPFCTATDPELRSGRYHMRCPFPDRREGRHLIYNIWQRDDSPEAFYACSDVVFGEEGEDDAATAPACDAPEWHPESIYVGGDLVVHEGRRWRAKWWTRGETPGTTGEWGVWQEIPGC